MSTARDQPALDPADLPGVAFDDRWRLPIVDAAALAAACERNPSLSLDFSLVRDAKNDAQISGFGLQARPLARSTSTHPPFRSAAAAAASIQHRQRPSLLPPLILPHTRS